MTAVMFRRTSSRWALWAFAVALLLKAAMPMLASASAHAQSKAVAEICTVYGVSLVALDGQDHAPVPDHSAEHGSEHCAISALTALAAPEPVAPVVVATAADRSLPPRADSSTQAPDACAIWVARLKHGPPAFA